MNASKNLEKLPFLLCYSLISAEFVIYLLTFAASALNFHLVYKTSVIHKNLKFILTGQSFSIVAYAVVISSEIFMKFWTQNLEWTSHKFMTLVQTFVVMFSNYIGYAFLFERILATVLVKKYENMKSNSFNVCWICVITLAASLTTYFQSFEEDSRHEIALGTTVACLTSVIISLIEIFILALVTYINEKKYNLRIFMQSGNSLSEAYQLSENIRTGKQLAPTFFFHFFNTVSLGVGVTLSYCKVIWPANLGELYTYMYYLALAFSNLCIQITVIRCHPILNKRAALLYKNFKCHYCKRLRYNSQILILQKETRTNSAVNAVTTTVTGNTLMHEVTAEEHSQIMKKTWDKYEEIKGIKNII